MNNKLLIGGVVIVAVGLLILGKFSSNQNPSNSAISLHNNVSTGSAKVNPAPDFTLSKLGGGTVSLSEFKGKKPVVIDFWASWCPNCRRDIPHLNSFYQKYKDQVEVIGVNLQEGPATVANFITSQGVVYPIALDPNSQASQAYGVQYTNYHVLIDKNGNLVRTIPGDISESDIISLIDQGVSTNDRASPPDKKPCKVASADGSGQAGICINENL